jgi:hypothetical protein
MMALSALKMLVLLTVPKLIAATDVQFLARVPLIDISAIREEDA